MAERVRAVPMPVGSPQVPLPPEGKTDPAMFVTAAWAKRRAKKLAWRMTAGIVVGAIGVAFTVFFTIESRYEKQLELRVAPIEKHVGELEDDNHELGKDLRELYRVMPRSRASDRLERPFPDHDGGAP